MDCIPFFIAILLLIILVNINIKEGFSNNITSDIIKSNETKLVDNILKYKQNFLFDFNKNIQATLNRNYNNVNDSSSNEIDFETYTTKYKTRDPSFVIINDLKMSIKYTSIYDSDSYNSLQTALISCQNIINIVGLQINEETSLLDDINEYKILLICIKILNDVNEQYNKFNYIFNSSSSFTDISGLNLLESQELIIQVIHTILFQLPILMTVCIPYFMDKTTTIDLTTIKISDITKFGPIIDMLKVNEELGYDKMINNFTNNYNDLILTDKNNNFHNQGNDRVNIGNNVNQDIFGNYQGNIGNNQGNIGNYQL